MNKYISLITKTIFSLIILFSLYCIFSTETIGALKGGCAKVNITPPVGTWLTGFSSRTKPSDNIADELYAKVLVLDDGQNTIAIISLDLCYIPLEMTNKIRKIVKERISIPEENIMICASHTHFGPKIFDKDLIGPEDNKPDKCYVQTLVNKISGALSIAHKNMQEVKIGFVKGEIPEIVYNRRVKTKDNSIKMMWTIPEDEALPKPIIKKRIIDSQETTITIPSSNPDLIFGHINPEVKILKIEDSSSNTIGSLINFACHPSSGASYSDWLYSFSADYPGYAMKIVEELEGGICMFSLGTAADLTAIKRGKEPRIKLGKSLGGEVIRRLQFLNTTDKVTLNALVKAVEIPLKKELPSYEVREIDVEPGATKITTEIQVLKIGDIFILGLPGEIMTDIGFDIKRESGINNLIIITLCNDEISYVCKKETYEEGGYEPNEATCLAKGAGEIILNESLKIIEEIKRIE